MVYRSGGVDGRRMRRVLDGKRTEMTTMHDSGVGVHRLLWLLVVVVVVQVGIGGHGYRVEPW